MTASRANQLSALGLVLLSLTALLTVLPFVVRLALTGSLPPPEPDEGVGAHVFQLSIVALAPMGLVFLATADWSQPTRILRCLILPAALAGLAFGILFYVEQIYYPTHLGRLLPSQSGKTITPYRPPARAH